MDFKNKVVVVTGGGQGIGKAICLKFALANGKVIIIDMNEKAVKTVEDEIREKGFDAVAYKGDVSDAEGMKTIFNEILCRLLFHPKFLCHVCAAFYRVANL